MRYCLIVLLFFISSCNIQTRYHLKKQASLQPAFQNTEKHTPPPSIKKNTPQYLTPSTIKKNIPKFSPHNTVIANMQSEITRLNTISEQLMEKVNSLETLLLKIKNNNKSLTTSQKKTSTLTKKAKKLIKKKRSTKKKKKKLGNFAKAQKAFQKKQWEVAIQNYEQYRKLNPKGNSYALATYNIALSLEKLGLREEANSFYDEILDPRGPYFRSKLAEKIKSKKKRSSSKKAKKI